jgi:uncharacterized membrane protein YeaQ/YmgE (transglycosylase-associated protein family)
VKVTYTDIGEFLKGALVGIVGDYVLYNIIQSFSTATPGWSPYGWGLFVAFNGAIVLWLKHALTK